MNDLDDEPLTLDEACTLIFKDRIKAGTLRVEATRGNLRIERIGRRDFVTRAAIREMREKCQMVPPQKGQGSGSSHNGSGRTEASQSLAGASETTDDTSVALSSLLIGAQKLNKNFTTTSGRSTRSRRDSLSLVKG